MAFMVIRLSLIHVSSYVNIRSQLGSLPFNSLWLFSYDGTILTTFLGMDTTYIPEGMTLYDFVNQTVSELEGLHMPVSYTHLGWISR